MKLEELNRLYRTRVRAYSAYCKEKRDEQWVAYLEALSAEDSQKRAIERESGRQLWLTKQLDAYEFRN